MKSYKVDLSLPNNGAIISINGKNPSKHVKSSSKFNKLNSPIFFDDLIINGSSLKNFYKCKDTNTIFMTGLRTIWQLRLVK